MRLLPLLPVDVLLWRFFLAGLRRLAFARIVVHMLTSLATISSRSMLFREKRDNEKERACGSLPCADEVL